VVFFPNLDPNRLHTTGIAPLTQEERTVVIFEVGHTSDRNMVEAMEQKTRQHREGVLTAATQYIERMWRTRRKLLTELHRAGPGPG